MNIGVNYFRQIHWHPYFVCHINLQMPEDRYIKIKIYYENIETDNALMHTIYYL